MGLHAYSFFVSRHWESTSLGGLSSFPVTAVPRLLATSKGPIVGSKNGACVFKVQTGAEGCEMESWCQQEFVIFKISVKYLTILINFI